MKKKIVLSAIILAMIVFALVGCNDVESVSDVCAELNEMAKMEYNLVNLEIQTTQNGITLVNKFTSNKSVNNTMVTYQLEELATIESDGNGGYVIPDEMIIKTSGTAEIKDGKIVGESGEKIEIPVENLDRLTLYFSEHYFSSQESKTEGNFIVFTANVSNPKGFTGNSNFDGKDMVIEVKYRDKLNVVKVDYLTENGASVKVTYTFA